MQTEMITDERLGYKKDTSSSDTADDTSKKLIRSVQELAKQLEYITSKCSNIESLFDAELLTRRAKMKELCQKLLFEEPKICGALARDKLWRFVFYDVVSRAKRLKQNETWTDVEKSYFRQHILRGIGELSLLMLKMSETINEFKNMNLRFCPNGFDNLLPNALLEEKNTNNSVPEKWAVELLCTLLLNLGDLCRYLTEFHANNREVSLNYYDKAQDYYMQAFVLNPSSGMAHNQMGNLSLNENGLESIYHFLTSLVSEKPYMGALTNLRRLLDSRLVYYATLPGTFEWKRIDLFTHCFVQLLNQFFTDSTHLTNFEKSCTDTVGSFVSLLDEGIALLDDVFLFRVMSISIMVVWCLIAQGYKVISPAVCFAIGIFVQLINKLSIIVQNHSKLMEEADIDTISEVRAPQFTQESNTTTTSNSPTTVEGVEVEEEPARVNVPDRNKRRRLKTRRRTHINDLYAYLCSDEEDWSENESVENVAESDSDSNSDISESLGDYEEEEEVSDDVEAMNGRRAISEVSDISYETEMDIERKAAALKLSQSSDEHNMNFEVSKEKKVKVKNVLDLVGLESCWDEMESILIAMLSFTRWLRCWLPVQNAFAASTEKELLEKLCQVLNTFESTNWSLVLKRSSAKDDLQVGKFTADGSEVDDKLIHDWNEAIQGKLDESLFSLELPEDVAISGWHPLKSLGSTLEKSKFLTRSHMMVTRIGRLLVFGNWLVGTEEFAVIRSDQTFLVPSIEAFKRHMRKLQLEKFNRRLTKRKEAKLCGQEYIEPKNRFMNRKSIGGRRRGPFNQQNGDDKVYIFFDLPAVLKHLRIIQKLCRNPRFIIVFPFTVSHALDELKDANESSSKVARIINRWIEQNYRSNGNIRLLQKDERIPLRMTDNAVNRNKDPMINQFFETLESCNFIRSRELRNMKSRPQGKFFKDARDNFRIFYLTGYKTLLDPLVDITRDFKPIDTCRASHVYLDRITRYQRRKRKMRSRQSGG